MEKNKLIVLKQFLGIIFKEIKFKFKINLKDIYI
jgi:hypothetical protein